MPKLAFLEILFTAQFKAPHATPVPLHLPGSQILLRNSQRWRRASGGYNPSTDPVKRLARHKQTTIFRLRTGHCGLRAHLKRIGIMVCLLVGCLTSQQQASVSQGRICSDNFTCCHTEIEAADQTFYLTQSQYTDTGPTSPSADPITPGVWQGSQL